MALSRNILGTALLCATGIALALAFGQWTRARQASASLQMHRANQARASLRVTAVRQEFAIVQREIEALHVSQGPVIDSPATLKSSPPPPPSDGSGGELAELIAEHPAWASVYQAGERAQFLHQYMPLIHSLEMSSQQRESFLGELSEREKAAAVVRITVNQNGWTPDDPRLASLKQENVIRQAHTFTSLLGPDGYRQFQEFERTLGVRYLVNNLATQLYSTASPLGGVLAENLTRALASHAADTEGKIRAGSIRWDTALPAAQALLSPEQFAILVRMREAEQQQQRLNRIVARKQLPTGN